ncbi:hypothetical protein BDV93DRAFT_219539 [Ceratobasidium sp. AG-I]|nr:hypothetical protein BDV93DRAFT_219539 [Ceratobasidium sp. AG-I]
MRRRVTLPVLGSALVAWEVALEVGLMEGRTDSGYQPNLHSRSGAATEAYGHHHPIRSLCLPQHHYLAQHHSGRGRMFLPRPLILSPTRHYRLVDQTGAYRPGSPDRKRLPPYPQTHGTLDHALPIFPRSLFPSASSKGSVVDFLTHLGDCVLCSRIPFVVFLF